MLDNKIWQINAMCQRQVVRIQKEIWLEMITDLSYYRSVEMMESKPPPYAFFLLDKSRQKVKKHERILNEYFNLCFEFL